MYIRDSPNCSATTPVKSSGLSIYFRSSMTILMRISLWPCKICFIVVVVVVVVGVVVVVVLQLLVVKKLLRINALLLKCFYIFVLIILTNIEIWLWICTGRSMNRTLNYHPTTRPDFNSELNRIWIINRGPKYKN